MCRVAGTNCEHYVSPAYLRIKFALFKPQCYCVLCYGNDTITQVHEAVLKMGVSGGGSFKDIAHPNLKILLDCWERPRLSTRFCSVRICLSIVGDFCFSP